LTERAEAVERAAIKHDNAETVLVEISVDNYNKIMKIRDDYRHAQAHHNADGTVDMPDMTTNDVISELVYGRY
jgi:glutaredoxin-related protein